MILGFTGKNLALYFLFILVFVSCTDVKNKNKSDKTGEIKNKYAELFKTEYKDDYVKLTVFSVDGNITDEYYLVEKNKKSNKIPAGKKVINIPVEKVICLSTSHIAFLNSLGCADNIVAVSGSKYIYDKKLREKADKGDLPDAGYENSLDYEKILSLKPDIITVYEIPGSVSPAVNKLKHYGIPVITVNEYAESSALAQAEWIKFFSVFFKKEKQAGEYFDKIAGDYEKYKKICDTVKIKPSVLLNMPWKGIWYVPGGKSNVARLIEDAGGNYLWADTDEKHNYSLSLEEVFDKAYDADFWLNPGQANSLEDIKYTDKRLTKFTAYRNGKVFNRNKRLNKYGGNDYMESGTVRPDLILKDLIKILHPEILPEDTFYYYKKLN